MVRRRSRLIGAGVAAVALAIGAARAARYESPHPALDDVRKLISADVDSLDQSLAGLQSILGSGRPDSARIRFAFRTARQRYKHLEAVAEFYAPALAAAFNSRRQEVDDDDAPPPATLSPSGFPALETVVFVPTSTIDTDSARRIVTTMRPLVGRLKDLLPALMPTSAQVIEIARLEIARVSTLGIAGFDAPGSGAGISESADALDGVRALLGAGGRQFWPGLTNERRAADSSLGDASRYLRANTDFDSFNRLAFIVGKSIPASNALDALRRAANTSSVQIPRAWRADAPSVYSPDAFNALAYAPSGTPAATPQLIALGTRLFFEPSMSGSGTRSCASCHTPSQAFSDGRVTAQSIDPTGARIRRNTPTLLNAAIQPAQFADERSVTLEDQALEVLRSPAEMGSSDVRAAAVLQSNTVYRTAFASVFAAQAEHAVTPLRVRQALAAYIRSLTALDSRFDRAVRGDTLALTSDERHGFTLFMGKAGCGTCHFAPLFGGNTPPLYMHADVEVIGTTRGPGAKSPLDPDSGRAAIDHLPLHLRAFKTPSLRNVTATAPYMHNGAFRSLDEVLRFYEAGGGLGRGARIDNQTLSADSLHLTTRERSAIISFLGALSDRTR